MPRVSLSSLGLRKRRVETYSPMSPDLLPAAVVAELLAIVQSPVLELERTAALGELADRLAGHRRAPSIPLTNDDERTVTEVRAIVVQLRPQLGRRMGRPALLATDTPQIVPGRFTAAPDFAGGWPYWKPAQGLWSSPQVCPGVSAWTLQANSVLPPDRLPRWVVELEDPPLAVLVDSLASADQLLAEAGDVVAQLWPTLHDAGVWRVDFAFGCVLEAELSVLTGERAVSAFPAGLGVESSLWLRRPDSRAAVPVAEPTDHTAPAPARSPRTDRNQVAGKKENPDTVWFRYR